jgi:hypothetical protein
LSYTKVKDNNDDDGAMCGGPVCHFNCIEIPFFVCCMIKASITSGLLVEMLKMIDSYELFDLSDGTLPFLLWMVIKVVHNYLLSTTIIWTITRGNLLQEDHLAIIQKYHDDKNDQQQDESTDILTVGVESDQSLILLL